MGQKYTSISDLYKQVKLNEQEIIERKLTPQELEDREKIAKKLPMADFKKRYGKDAMAVKMATATNIVKNKSRNESINEDGHTDVASATRQCKTILEDAMQILQKLKSMSPEDSLPSWWTNKLAVSSNSLNKLRDYFLVPSVSEETLNCGCGKEICETYGDINETIPKSTMYALVKDGKVIAKGSKRDMMSKKKKEGGTVYNSPGTKVGDTIKEGVDIQEDGHDDVASAIRQCKTVTEDAMQILQKLQTMSPDGALPTWWSNKLAIHCQARRCGPS
mgnify:CR=1 FL=1